MKRILIDGPTGVIGMSLIEYCIKNHTQVVAICHKNSKRTALIPKHPLVRVVEADLSDYGELACLLKQTGSKCAADGQRATQKNTVGSSATAFDGAGNQACMLNAAEQLRSLGTGYDAFYHFAWNGTFGDTRNDMSLQVQNIQYSLDAVDLAGALECQCFIGAGSQAEYGRVEGVLTPGTPAFPENGYGMAKLCAGQMTRQLCASRGMRHIWVRILSVYGRHDGAYTMIMSALEKMSAKEETAFTPGGQQWDYLNGRDAARAMYLIGERGTSGKTYVLGSGKARPLREYLEILAKGTGYERPLGLGKVPYAPKQVMHLCADITELTQDTGFVPEVSFEEGVRELVEAEYKNKYKNVQKKNEGLVRFSQNETNS